MTGHLCLKWNNHSSAFLTNINKIKVKEAYCDATIACQGKYFPVHRIVLSTCSDYFDEIFDRIGAQHPYILCKDIEPNEMELLLNYMYQGEINVPQENLHKLINAAEALRVKGLAVPDDLPTNKENNSNTSKGKRRMNSNSESVPSKKRTDEKRQRRDSNEKTFSNLSTASEDELVKAIKEEPVDTCYEEGNVSNSAHMKESENNCQYSTSENEPFIKCKDNISDDENFENQATSWSEYNDSSNIMDNLPPAEMNLQDDVYDNRYEMKTVTDISSDSCPSTSQNSGNLTWFGTSQNMSKQNLQCLYCKFECNWPVELMDHLKTKHSGERRFSCIYCPRRFNLKTDLTRHVLTHTGEKPFKCHICPKKFIREDHLRKHLQKHLAQSQS